MNVLVIIVTYNAMKWVNHCFACIGRSSISLDCFVIDNGSSDGTVEFINSTYPQFKLYVSKINLGFGKANNIGIQYAIEQEYDYVYLLNQDAWVEPNTIEKLIKINLAHPEYGILSPFQLQANEKHLDNNFNEWTCSYGYTHDLLNDLYFGKIKDVYEVFDVMAAHWLISRKCFMNVGGFSPTFPQYGEDVNYTNRAKFYNFKIGIVPEAKAIHDREYRINAKTRILYMQFISNLIELSEITNKKEVSLFKIFVHSISNAIAYKSYVPIKYTWKIFRSLGVIKKNKEISKSKGAFVVIKK